MTLKIFLVFGALLTTMLFHGNSAVADGSPTKNSAVVSPEWVIPGDFTLRYTVFKIDTRPLAVREAFRQDLSSFMVRDLFKQAHGGREPSAGETISPDIMKQAETDSEKQSDLSTRPMTLTLAQHANNFLYLLMSRQPDPTDWKLDGVPSQLVLMDGKNSISHQFIKDGGFTIISGLNGRDLNFMPVFCSRLSAFPLIKDLTSTKHGDFQGTVLDPGNSVGRNSYYYYDPTTIVRVAYASGKPRITQITRYDPDGTISRQMDVTDWLLFKGVWIPSKAQCTYTYFASSGKRSPSFAINWTLIDAKEAADAHQFDLNAYLHKGDHVIQVGLASGQQTIFSYDPQKSLQSQKDEALLFDDDRMLTQGQTDKHEHVRASMFSLVTIIFCLGIWALWRRSSITKV